jgi:hypothetical protein
MRTRFSPWMAKKPIVKPMSLCLSGAGKAKMAANRMISASTPLQPRSMRTPKPVVLSRMTLDTDITLSSKTWMIQALTSAMSEVNGRMTYFSAGCRISSVNRPTSNTVNSTKKRIMGFCHRACAESGQCYPNSCSSARWRNFVDKPGGEAAPRFPHRTAEQRLPDRSDGLGKTTIGQRVAQLLDLEFLDCDHELEAGPAPASP